MKKLLTVLIILALCLISTKVLWHQGFPYTHDGENHLARFANYKIALKERQIPPRFAPNLLNRYGYPVFNYNYPLANILSLPFSFFKINYQVTFKVLVFIFLVLGSFGVISLAKIYSKKVSSQLVALVSWLLAPPLLNAIAFRGNIGEIIAYSLLPWLFWSLFQLKKPLSYIHSISIILLWSAFLLSHNITVLFAGIVLAFFYFYLHKLDMQVLKRASICLFFTVSFTLWFWLPAVLELNQTILSSAALQKQYLEHFPTFNQLIHSPIEFGYSYAGSLDSLGFSTSPVVLLATIVAILLFFKNRKFGKKSNILWYLVTIVLLLFFQTETSSIIWQHLPFGNFIQFPWRLGLLIPTVSIPITMLVWERSGIYFKLLLLTAITISFFTVFNIRAVDYFNKTIIDYDAYSMTTSTSNENMPKDFTYTQIADWQPTPTTIGAADIEVIKWFGSEKIYKITTSENITVIEPTAYFLGWESKDLNSNQKINYDQTTNQEGRIAYTLPPGSYTIQTRFTQNTVARKIGNYTFLLGLVMFSLYSLKYYKNA